LVLHDEIDLPFGDIKLKQWWGHAWHNGLRDIIAKLWTNSFSRIRIGVGRPTNGQDVASYVLSNFGQDELTQLYHERTTIDQMISSFVK
jgi:PTH1 family peptidyl-tRNA hydrolase